MEVENFLIENQQCYDRFTFDKIFRFLLRNDFTNEEAKDIILIHCSISSLVVQERIHNAYYKKIRANERTSEDLLELKNEIYNKIYLKYRKN